MQIEAALAVNDLATATSLINEVIIVNSVETNYKNYYDIYLAYANVGFVNDITISFTDLFNLASLCPGREGACIYQARALYNSIFNSSQAYPGCTVGDDARMSRQVETAGIKKQWQINLYPNPAANIIYIQSNVENELVTIEIFDLSGRTILIKDLKLKKIIANLDLNLTNGAYFVTITNSNNEKLIKKLLINH